MNFKYNPISNRLDLTGSNVPINIDVANTDGILVYNGSEITNYASPTINSSGVYQSTTQPSFFGYLATTQNNVSGAGATYVLGTAPLTIVYNVGSMLNANGVFTAAYTGKYSITYGLNLFNMTASMTALRVNIIPSGGNTFLNQLNPNNVKPVGAALTFTQSIPLSLTAGDTVIISFTISNGASGNVASLVASAGFYLNFFSGIYLG